MTSSTSTAIDERVAFRRDAKQHLAQGRIDLALALCDSSAERARRLDDQDFLDQTTVTRANLLVQSGDGDRVVPELRRLLLRTTDLANRFYAAYAISYHYDLAGNSDKSRFYARQALRFAEQWGNREAMSGAHNVLANLLVLDSFFDEAETEYDEALQLLDPVDSPERAILLSNIGYCRIVLGRLRQGYSDLTVSLRMLRRLDAGGWSHLPMMGLSFACLELGKPERACKYAEEALEISETTKNPDNVKKCLYLLGEAEKYCGRTTAAYESFSRLQRSFYPENPMIVDFLMAADVRRMINLMA